MNCSLSICREPTISRIRLDSLLVVLFRVPLGVFLRVLFRVLFRVLLLLIYDLAIVCNLDLQKDLVGCLEQHVLRCYFKNIIRWDSIKFPARRV